MPGRHICASCNADICGYCANAICTARRAAGEPDDDVEQCPICAVHYCRTSHLRWSTEATLYNSWARACTVFRDGREQRALNGRCPRPPQAGVAAQRTGMPKDLLALVRGRGSARPDTDRSHGWTNPDGSPAQPGQPHYEGDT